MNQKSLTFEEFADLLHLEAARGIINKDELLNMIMQNKLPKEIRDVRGALRLALEREGNLINVTKFPTELSLESINEISPQAANNNDTKEAA